MTDFNSRMISYDLAPKAHQRYRTLLHKIATRPAIRRVCDVGGGANPDLSQTFTAAHDLDYQVLDISAEELAKAPSEYTKVQKDITDPHLSISGAYDFVFSKFVAEHVSDGRLFHRNVLRMLDEGGYALHLFPTLYALPYLANLVVPEALSSALLNFFHPRDRDTHDKFPAHYHWCRGPTTRQIRRFEELGYDIVEYGGFFGTPNYFAKIPPVKKVDQWLATKLVSSPLPLLTSFACVLLRKPVSA